MTVSMTKKLQKLEDAVMKMAVTLKLKWQSIMTGLLKTFIHAARKLLEFMENRWEFSFNSEQLDKLVYVNFAVDGRTVPEELPVPERKVDTIKRGYGYS
mgnify:CR=1 FL=1